MKSYLHERGTLVFVSPGPLGNRTFQSLTRVIHSDGKFWKVPRTGILSKVVPVGSACLVIDDDPVFLFSDTTPLELRNSVIVLYDEDHWLADDFIFESSLTECVSLPTPVK